MDISSNVTITEFLDYESSILREIGEYAIWSLSSVKSGNCVEQIRDNDIDTYWQSDGSQPHMLNIQFINKTCVSKICIYVDYKQDESYTPKKMIIKIGNCTHDLYDYVTVDLIEPLGWVNIPLKGVSNYNNNDGLTGSMSDIEYIRTFFIQIRFLTMHQNGKDARVRSIKCFSPRKMTINPSIATPTIDNTMNMNTIDSTDLIDITKQKKNKNGNLKKNMKFEYKPIDSDLNIR